MQVLNPAIGKLLARMPKMRADETRMAVAAADSVLPQWRKRTAKERGAVLRKWHDEIALHREDLATILTMECGKPLAEARAEVASGCVLAPLRARSSVLQACWAQGSGLRARGSMLGAQGSGVGSL